MTVLELLEQTEVWTSHDGTTRRLRDMPRRHKLNVLGWLRAHAASLALAHDVAAGDDQLFRCDEWLESQPLVRRLVELVGQDASGPVVRRIYQCARCRSGRLRIVTGPVTYVDVVGAAGDALVVRGDLPELDGAYLACRECRWSGPLPRGLELVTLPETA